MRRIKQVPQGVSQAAFERLSVAVVLSATLHVYLIFGLALAPPHRPTDRFSIVYTRLVPEPATQKRPALLAPAKRDPIPSMQPQVPSLAEPIEMPVPATQVPPAEDRSPEPEISTASLPDPIHYAAKELDVYPQPLNPIEPAYPQIALAGEIGGWVTALLLIDESGRITDVSVVDASPQDVFEESALKALLTTTYSPAEKGGRAVRSRILVRLDYDPIAAAATH